MNFFFDNNLSVYLARAIGELSKVEQPAPKVIHLIEKFRPNCPDVEWISKLASEGNWAVLSQDRFKKHDIEREAVKESGLVIFALDRNWASQPHWHKAQNLVRWWPAIMDQSQRYQGGAALRVPWRMSGKGRFEQIRL